MSRGVGAPSPPDAAAAPRAGRMLRAEREGAAGTAPCPAARGAVRAGRLRCGALLLLAVCVCAAAVPGGRGAPAAVTGGAPGSSASRRGAGDSLGTARGDLLSSGCLPGVVAPGTGAGGRSLGPGTAATRTPRSSLQRQPGPGRREGLRPGTAVPVGLSLAQRPGRREPAAPAGLCQPEGVPSPGSWRRAGPGSPGATRMPAVTSAAGPGQRAGTAEPQSPPRGSEATSRAWSEAAAGVPATSRARLQPPSLPTAAPGPSAGAAVTRGVPSPVVPLRGAAAGSPVPPGVPTGTLMGAGSWSPSTAEQEVASALPRQGTPSSAGLSPGTVGVPPALTPEGLWGTAGTALPGPAAPSEGALLAQVPGNGSGLLGAVLASLPTPATAPGAHSQQGLPSSLPTVASGAPAVPSGTQSEWPSPPAQPVSPGACPAQPRAPSPAGPTVPGMSSTATGAIPELGQRALMEGSRPSKPGTAPMGPVPTAAGPAGPGPASPGSVPPPCSPQPALQHGPEPGHGPATRSSVTSPSCPPASPGAGRVAISLLSSQSLAVPTGAALDAHVVSSGPSASQHSCPATEPLPAGSRAASSPAELLSEGRAGSTGMEAPAPHPSSCPLPAAPVHVLPLRFRLLGIAYGPALGSRNSPSYRQLEADVTLMLKQMLSSYRSFLQANVLEFLNGSVVVRGEVLFRGDAPAPTSSHLIRTVVTEASKSRSFFSWQLEPQSVQSGGFSLENLEPEKLSISLTGSQLGLSGMDPLERLVREVTAAVSALYHVRSFTISQLRELGGNTEITGDLYLDTVVHADVTEVLEALTALSGLSLDLSSLSVEGSQLDLHVYPLSLVVTNRHFSQELQDPLSAEHHNLSRDLGHAVARALRDYPTFLTAIMKGFLPGSLICHGKVIFRHPAPTSMEVLETLVRSVGPMQALAGSDIQVDPHSLSVGEDSLDPPRPQPGFPAYGVAIVVIGGLCIIAAPVVLMVRCLGTKRLGWQDGRALWHRRDPEVGIQTLDMDNQGFWMEGPEDGYFEWQSTFA